MKVRKMSKQLPKVSVSTWVVSVQAQGVFLVLDGGLAQQSKGPVEGDVFEGFPFLPHSFESAPGALR